MFILLAATRHYQPQKVTSRIGTGKIIYNKLSHTSLIPKIGHPKQLMKKNWERAVRDLSKRVLDSSNWKEVNGYFDSSERLGARNPQSVFHFIHGRPCYSRRFIRTLYQNFTDEIRVPFILTATFPEWFE